ncbi:MAG: glutamyl-tRNA reductase [Candidatus Omnitrophica bacterium]|nr:glutamyl-tRNA reductase [Candidatus Omnitrophota bacterium]
MDLAVIGINHKMAPVGIREKFSFSSKQIVEVNRMLKGQGALSENLILSTCNRMEIYVVVGQKKDFIGPVKDFLSRFHNLRLADYEGMFYVYRDKEAIEHLFRVSSGLDSMVIGEMEILGQVKKAYQDARESRSTGKILNRLFEKALNTAKKIRSDTLVGRGAISVSSAAIRLAKKILGGVDGKVALVISAGLIGEQLVSYLKKSGIKNILVANRTLDKAKILTDKFSATAVSFDSFKERLGDVDIVITSTGAPYCIIHKDDMLGFMPKRKQKPLFIIDLAVPRDVDAEVSKIDNVYLYNIDDLQKIIEQNISLRKNELDTCDRIIDNSTEAFMDWWLKENIKYGAQEFDYRFARK